MLSSVLVGSILLIFVLACFAMRNLDPDWKRSYNPFVILAGATILYTVTPWADSIGTSDPMMEDFLKMQLVAVLGLAAGAAAAHLRHPPRPRMIVVRAVPRFGPKSIAVALGVSITLFLISYEIYYGGLKNLFLFGYRGLKGTDTSTDSIWRFGALVLVQYGLPATLLVVFMVQARKNLFYITTGIYVLLMLISGTRNFLIMFIGNLLIFSSILHRRFTYPKLGIASALGLVFLLTIGVYRNFGLEARSDFFRLYSSQSIQILNPNNQELGTSYSVFRINYSDPAWYDWAPGESYLNAALSVIPTHIWPSRPDSVSRKFSTYFAMPGEGLGFSNILEAYLNGGLPLVFIVNFLLAYGVVYIYNRLVIEQMTLFGLAFYGNIIFVAFNWNRIDFQTVFKISMIRIGMFYVISLLLLKLIRLPGRPAMPPQAPARTPRRLAHP